MTADAPSRTLHASVVAVTVGDVWRGALILGPSGSGKSALALRAMALGARLVADDRVRLWRQGDSLLARAPSALFGMIEARGIGLLRAESLAQAPVALAIDLGRAETQRLPPLRRIDLLDLSFPLVHGAENGCLAPAMLQLLKGGMVSPDSPIRAT